MYPAIARNFLLPLQEALLGRTTFAIWRTLTELAGAGRSLAEVQRAGLGRLLDHARGTIPYWQRRLDGLIPPDTAGDVAGLLARVPVLTRAEIHRHREAMRWPAPR